VEIAAGKIVQVTPCALAADEAARLPWLAPGMVDLQFNGYGGQEFSAPDITPETVAEITRTIVSFGVTRFCPTLTTQRSEVMVHALRAIAAACEAWREVARLVAGIHLEGPYISSEEGVRGAHPREFCRPPDWDEFQQLQQAAGGRIRLLTMSVEFPGSPAFIERVAQSGVVVAIGHTAANAAQIRAAVDAGARLSTHLGNGCHPLLRRHRNYLWDQLAEDRLMASLIVDGHHLPPEVVKTFVRAKTPQRCILISDMSGLAGRPPGHYASSLCDVEILASGRLVIAGQRELLAGAALPIGVGVANVMHFVGLSLAEAVPMATEHPSRLLGVTPGGLKPGDPADLVLFDLHQSPDDGGRRFDVRATLVEGDIVFGAL
jgi:N-acetylglucosamine-6-phosphate deacetylase